MKINLWLKLTGTFALTVFLTAAALMLSVTVITENRYRLLVRDSDRAQAEALSPRFAEWYKRQGAWYDVSRLVESLSPASRMMGTDHGMSMMGMDEGLASMFPRLVLSDATGTILADSAGELIGSTLLADKNSSSGVDVVSGGKIVGRLFVGSMIEPTLTQADQKFLGSVNTAMSAVTVVSVLLSVILGSLLFRHIVAPLRKLSRASERISSGDLETRVKQMHTDEIGELAARFNVMAEKLQVSRQRERQFIADAAHELRTPVTLLQGTLEMMIDGIYPADRPRLEQLYGESQRLGRLVADLQDLSRATSGRLKLSVSTYRIGEVLEEVATLFSAVAGKKNVHLDLVGDAMELDVAIDKDRMVRVMSNLFGNALRHTPGNSRIVVSVEQRKDQDELLVCVEDAGPGIPISDAERVFDRFYRADESRSRDSGGSGLGLSISRDIIAAHRGRMWVDSSCRTGARLCFTIPR